MWKWIEFSFRVWTANLTAWLVISLGLGILLLIVLVMTGLLKVLML